MLAPSIGRARARLEAPRDDHHPPGWTGIDATARRRFTGMRLLLPATDLPRRLPRLFLGLALFGVGIAFMVRADLGLSPWDVLHEGVAGRTALSIGMVSILTSLVVLLLWIPLRERPGIGTLCNAVVIGLVVDATLWAMPEMHQLAPRIALMLLGPVVVAVGSGYYIGAGLGPGPRDGLMTGLARRGPAIGPVRGGIELVVLLLGWALGGTVGVGTVVFTLGIGPLVHLFLGRLEMDDPSPSPVGVGEAVPEPAV